MARTVRRRDPEGRRTQLIEAAARVFAYKSVSGATVSDIVKAAGVAQGTFYLYFTSKEAIVEELVDRIATSFVDAIERAVASGRTAVGKLLAMRDVLAAEAADPALRHLVEFMHSPANEAVHRRMAERLTGRLADLMERIVAEGVAEGSFHVDDERVAAWFVLSGLQAAERAVSDPDAMPAALAEVTTLSLRALGYEAAGSEE